MLDAEVKRETVKGGYPPCFAAIQEFMQKNTLRQALPRAQNCVKRYCDAVVPRPQPMPSRHNICCFLFGHVLSSNETAAQDLARLSPRFDYILGREHNPAKTTKRTFYPQLTPIPPHLTDTVPHFDHF